MSPEATDHPLALIKEFLLQQRSLGLEALPLGQGLSSASAESLYLEVTAEVTAGVTAGVAASSGTRSDVDTRLEAFHESIRDCTACRLSEKRQVVVFGSGNPEADVMFIGEAPGAEEDREGVPFVGAAGQLLTKMIEAIDLRRDDVYIANVIKCRPPGNRDPEPDEIASCQPYLEHQIDLIQPVVICTLGRFAAQLLLQSRESMGRLRGRVFSYRGIKLIPTYHPSALLRNEKWKRPAWDDLKLLRREYDGKIV